MNTPTNILLVSPAANNEALWITGSEDHRVKNNAPPLALATLAALTPKDFHVDIWDEVVHGTITDDTVFPREYAIVGVTGYKAHLVRNRQLAAVFRRRGWTVAVGGPGVSATPDEYRDAFDILFIGEAERTWPAFLRDWQAGRPKREYRQIQSIDMAESPVPRWELIADDAPAYSMGAVQTTRGCPFDCEFCDVVYLFGHRPRHKPIATVLAEVRLLARLGFKAIFFSDDEFIGDPPYARELLAALIEENRYRDHPLAFSTQLTLRVSKDDELLALLADANFDVLFIGIETPNPAALRESNKLHNLGGDLVAKVHKIQSYGIVVRSGIIVGFDSDSPDIFAEQERFIQASCIPSVAINMLKAPFGTRLWERLRRENRVLFLGPEVRPRLGHPRSYTTIIPKQMSRVELMQGYRRLLERVFSWELFCQRLQGFIANLKRIPRVPLVQPTAEELAALPSTLGLNEEETRLVTEVFAACGRTAPSLLGRIRALVVQHGRYRQDILRLLPQIDRQIAMEQSGELALQPDHRPVPVPPAFRRQFRAIFNLAYDTVTAHCPPGTDPAPILLETFVRFLDQHGEGFQELTPDLAARLAELAATTAAAAGGQGPGGTAVLSKGQRGHLADDILKNLHQVLVSRALCAAA